VGATRQREKGGREREARADWARACGLCVGERREGEEVSGPRGGGRERGRSLGRAVQGKREKGKMAGLGCKGGRRGREREREGVGQLGWAQKKKREGNKMRETFECF
jgi:hypothetical protein